MLQASACDGKSGGRELPGERNETFADTHAQSVAGEDPVTAATKCQVVQVL